MQSWFRANLIWHLQELPLLLLATGRLILLPGFAKPALLLPSTVLLQEICSEVGCVVILHCCVSSSAEVQAVLLSDMLVFLQEKDQKYVFASLVRLQPFFFLTFQCERPMMLCCAAKPAIAC